MWPMMCIAWSPAIWRALGAENFALNSFAITCTACFVIIVNLGYETFLPREIAYDATHFRQLVTGMISMCLLLSAGSSLLLWVSLWLFVLPPLGRLMVMIQGIILFGSAIDHGA